MTPTSPGGRPPEARDAPPATAPELEHLRRIGEALERLPSPALSPPRLVETLLRELPCAAVSLTGSDGASLAAAQSDGPPPTLTLDHQLPGSPLHLRVSYRDLATANGQAQLLRALVPWIALLLRKPSPPLSLDPLLARVSDEWDLSPAHQRVLRLVARGFSNKEIASELDCHIKTVEAHMTAILTRSQISSRGELLGRLLARLTGPG